MEVPCEVQGQTQTPLSDTPAKPILTSGTPIIKMPVVLAERTIQIVVEANIPLKPPAVEIKRVLKDVFLKQCKLVPVEFEPMDCMNVRQVKKAKLFVEGYIRKNIEYSTGECTGNLQDRIANVPFSGFADLTDCDFITHPILGSSTDNRSQFIHPKNNHSPRLDKTFFENSVFYNEQPYCELIRADFYELDFSPCSTHLNEVFDTLREKIVLDLTLKVLQVQQVQVAAVENK
ncbi:CsxC family protein [Bacillus toyonensis]|uniref:CsxC family protein n=1 Tax=Bacillus toyonensis TaxID=155322 RepID=UPI000BF0902F|nr:hypothetical protein [Bacillus toyonensis]PEO61382.1 hypothetical protein CN579_16835 [Bacillus toyonensis]